MLRRSRSLRNVDPTEVDGQFYTLADAEAVRHLFRVASGCLHGGRGSQILGQVRTAMSAAHNADSIDSVLSKLLHMAIRVGRRARRGTAISRYSTSIGTLAVRLARRIMGSSTGLRCWWSAPARRAAAAQTLVDSGGREAAGRKQGLGAGEEVGLATLLGGVAVPFEAGRGAERSRHCHQFVRSDSLPDHANWLKRWRCATRKPMMFVDIAVPRDIDPDIRQLANAHVFDIDDLQALAEDNIRERRRRSSG